MKNELIERFAVEISSIYMWESTGQRIIAKLLFEILKELRKEAGKK